MQALFYFFSSSFPRFVRVRLAHLAFMEDPRTAKAVAKDSNLGWVHGSLQQVGKRPAAGVTGQDQIDGPLALRCPLVQLLIAPRKLERPVSLLGRRQGLIVQLYQLAA